MLFLAMKEFLKCPQTWFVYALLYSILMFKKIFLILNVNMNFFRALYFFRPLCHVFIITN